MMTGSKQLDTRNTQPGQPSGLADRQVIHAGLTCVSPVYPPLPANPQQRRVRR
ncbi:MAG: hypothetical protein LBR86_07235 [Tannerella sp.]|nr:hypothetical protein [Tannerella sp.]